MKHFLKDCYMGWFAFSWSHPIIVAIWMLTPLWVVCGLMSIVLPRWAFFGMWMYGAAAIMNRVRPIHRLLRMRRYRAWSKKQHRGVERVYAAGCVCLHCADTRQEEPWHTEWFDQEVARGNIKVTVTKVDTEAPSRMTCGKCAAGQGDNCEEHS